HFQRDVCRLCQPQVVSYGCLVWRIKIETLPERHGFAASTRTTCNQSSDKTQLSFWIHAASYHGRYAPLRPHVPVLPSVPRYRGPQTFRYVATNGKACD